MTKEQQALDYIKQLVQGSEFEGKTFLAGGAVRDELMGKQIKDIDIVVSLPYGGIKFAEWITRKTGVYHNGANPVIFPKFGTAKFNFRNKEFGDVDIEVVMTRGEKYEKGSRKPEVVYADLKDDAFRRDLTVNSLFKDVVTGEILDLTGRGRSDIEKGVVRTPLDPDQTFQDDPLRMLRAIRFAVKYNWKMPKSLAEALKKNSESLQTISKERIRDELNKILVTNSPDKGLELLSYSGLNRYILPELDACRGVTQNEYHKDDVFDHILEVVKNTPPDLLARLGALFHDIGKPATRSVGDDGRVHFYEHEDVGAEMAKNIMERLRYTNEETSTVSRIVAYHMQLKQAGENGEKASDKQLRKFMARLGDDLPTALKVMQADNMSHSDDATMPNQIKGIAARLVDLKQKEGDTPVKLPINGNDIMKTLNIKPGPAIKDLLAKVQDAVYENPNLSREEALAVIQRAHKRSGLKDILKQKIDNPKTSNKIYVKTALSYPDTHPAKQTAIKLLKQHGYRIST